MNKVKDKKKFAELMMGLAEVFDDGKESSAMKIEIYWKALEEFKISDVEKAVISIVKNRVFANFPKPGEITQYISGDAEEKATKAWLKVSWAVKHIGQYASVRFDDPIIHSVIEAMGGWYQIQEIGKWHDTWTQKEFINLYKIMEKKDEHPKQCTGLTEVENISQGYYEHLRDPVFIGEGEGGRIMRLIAPPGLKLLKKGK